MKKVPINKIDIEDGLSEQQSRRGGAKANGSKDQIGATERVAFGVLEKPNKINTIKVHKVIVAKKQ